MVRFDEKKALELYEQGKRDAEIAQAVGACKSSVYYWRMRRKLPSKHIRKKPPKPVSKLSIDAMAARNAGMTYGAWKTLGN